MKDDLDFKKIKHLGDLLAVLEKAKGYAAVYTLLIQTVENHLPSELEDNAVTLITLENKKVPDNILSSVLTDLEDAKQYVEGFMLKLNSAGISLVVPEDISDAEFYDDDDDDDLEEEPEEESEDEEVYEEEEEEFYEEDD